MHFSSYSIQQKLSLPLNFLAILFWKSILSVFPIQLPENYIPLSLFYTKERKQLC